MSNPIACENTQTGSPSSQWDVSGSGDASIQGFATDISVDQGQTVRFKVNTQALLWRIDIYRLGYYGGAGARRVTSAVGLLPTRPGPQNQPACTTNATTGLVDCGNWAESASWQVPTNAVSGIYLARLVRQDTNGASHIVFVVRDDDGASNLLFQTSDTTWQAYNRYGGNSLYVGSPAGRAYKVSYNRPFTTRAYAPEDWLFNAEYPMVRWLEANGYNVSYTTGVDTDRRGSELTEHRVFLSVGHDEYWSGGQRANVEAARAAGVNLAFLSGNEVFWKTRWESSIAGPATTYRTLVSYKETHANAKIDPTPAWTGTWRDPRFSPPADGGRPENALTGQLPMVNDGATTAIQVPEPDGKLRLWRNTSVATLAPGGVATFPAGTLGYEWDVDADNGSRPAGLVDLSQRTVTNAPVLTDFGSTYASGTATHKLSLYRDRTSRALVFGAGTVQWSWGLDSRHDRGSAAADARMQQATVNLLADMGSQPATLQAGLTAATASVDTTGPVTTITSPVVGAALPVGSTVTITGTAADTGGSVGAVEVSTDGGTTWHPATGRAAWTYTWTPTIVGTPTIQVRAADDSANLGGVAARTVTVASGTCPCSVWPASTVPVNVSDADTSAVELGMKFRADSDGTVTGVRFYKGPLNTGTHVGRLWSRTGTLMSSVTFTNETASGWQQANFANPVAITAGQTYLVSYHAPNGRYSGDNSFFSQGVDNAPLHALANGVDGGNGVYRYGAGGVFPTDSFQATNYWVDVVYTTSPTPPGPDTTPPTLTSRSPASGADGVAVTTTVAATFSEPVDPATISFTLTGAGGAAVPGTTAYDPAARTATFTPTAPLAPATGHTATVAGARDPAGNTMATTSWSFTTAAAPAPDGPGGPILVLAADGFGRYYGDILQAEGLNAYKVVDLSALTPALLAAYDMAILGQADLSATQVTTLSNWVTGGGNLVAMRPDKDLAGLLGLTDAGGTVGEGYLKVDTSTAPGEGIVADTIQFHGTADRYNLAGARQVAELYTNATTASARPAVTVRDVGAAGGQAAAFTYDLARSVVLTRQGNPAWAGRERDGVSPIRTDDQMWGGAPSDPQPDWVNPSKVLIPQADEQQRLLANLIGSLTLDRKPLPRFWYLPRGLKAAVVMSGDDHGNGGTSGRFNAQQAASAPGCVVADWECIRSTSYIYPGTPNLSDSQAAAYTASGFEIGLHPNSACANYTLASFNDILTTGLADLSARLPSIPAPATNRTHCVAWSDWVSQPKAEAAHGIRLDANYYYWPANWAASNPGHPTGSGFPMRFADLDGTAIDVYQAATDLTDESGQAYPATSNVVLDAALDARGFYAVVTANMHTDTAASSDADAIIASAKARGVPVISARQLLTWLDGRNTSSFSQLTWNAGTLTFRINPGAGARGLQTLLPAAAADGRRLSALTRDGSAVPFSVQTVKGVQYATFAAAAGAWQATYTSGSTPPAITLGSVTTTDRSATVAWTTDEPTTGEVRYGTAPDALTSTQPAAGTATSQTVTLTGLAADQTYWYRVAATGASGVTGLAPAPPAQPASFRTQPASLTDTTVAHFAAGSFDTAAYIAEEGDGELLLAPTTGTEFSGVSLPTGWSSTPWVGGGAAPVSGGRLQVDGARAHPTATWSSGRSLEFVATFTGQRFQHVGLGVTLDSTPWAIFSTKSGGRLFARTSGSSDVETSLGSGVLNSPHRFRIDWTSTNVVYSVDGTVVATHQVAITSALRPIASDFVTGEPLTVDWMRLTPYATTTTFDSRILDAGLTARWLALSWTSSTPAGTSVAFQVRTGNTPTPDGTWTAFSSVAASGNPLSGQSRYLQYRVTLTTSNPSQTPVVSSVTASYQT